MASTKHILTLFCVMTALTLVTTGCGSDDNSPAAPVVDTAPPALPASLSVDYSSLQHTATVSWGQNVTDGDFEGFLVSRASNRQDPVAIVSDPQAANSYQDDDLVDAGRQVTYYVYSVDTSGNVSAAATVSLDLYDESIPARDEIPSL